MFHRRAKSLLGLRRSSSLPPDIPRPSGGAPAQLDDASTSLEKNAAKSVTPASQASLSPGVASVTTVEKSSCKPEDEYESPESTNQVLIVGRGVILVADVKDAMQVVVEGRLEGNITTDTFVLAEGGVVEGQVKCSHGRVDGELKAKITASDVLTIGSVANVTGDVEYGLLEVASGGMIHGMVTHGDQTQPSITCDEASSDEQNGGLETISEGIVAVDKAEVIAKSPEKSGGETNRGVVVLAEVQKDGLE